MSIPPEALQFVGSLVAIGLLVLIARGLGLGPERGFADETAARAVAEEVASGFAPVAVALDRDGRGALLRDASGTVMLLRTHGTHSAGRLLGPAASARREGEALVVDSGERRFGVARLVVADASAWMQAIEAIGYGRHA